MDLDLSDVGQIWIECGFPFILILIWTRNFQYISSNLNISFGLISGEIATHEPLFRHMKTGFPQSSKRRQTQSGDKSHVLPPYDHVVHDRAVGLKDRSENLGPCDIESDRSLHVQREPARKRPTFSFVQMLQRDPVQQHQDIAHFRGLKLGLRRTELKFLPSFVKIPGLGTTIRVHKLNSSMNCDDSS